VLTQAIEDEVAEWIDARADLRDSNGHRQVVRHGRLPRREVLTGLLPVIERDPPFGHRT
jgi:hypothetical protein